MAQKYYSDYITMQFRVYLIDAQLTFSIARSFLSRFIMLGMRKNGCQVNLETFYYAHLGPNLRYGNGILGEKS